MDSESLVIKDKNLPTRIIRVNEVMHLTGWSRVTIYRRVKNGDFVSPLQIGQSSIGWYAHEIEEYLKNLPRVSYSRQLPDSKEEK